MSSTTERRVYHERQFLWRCGLHAVNALLRARVYTAGDLDALADSLLTSPVSPFRHPHRAPFRLGDYDANVLISALHNSGLHARWLSSHRIIFTEAGIRGFLVNRAGKSYNALLTGRRHWISIVRYDSGFFLVDSQLLNPVPFHDMDELRDFLDVVKNDGGHILLIEEDCVKDDVQHLDEKDKIVKG